jgi:hypothetical protein
MEDSQPAEPASFVEDEPEWPFTRESIAAHAPPSAGVYEILQSEPYPRYTGTSRILEIGMSRSSLYLELLNHFAAHTAANRLARIRARDGIAITFRSKSTDSAAAKSWEKVLLQLFEREHWDLPVLNSQRGFARGADKDLRQKNSP